MGETPVGRNWIEIRLLNRLYDLGHSVGLSDLRNLIPGQGETIINTLFAMEKETLVRIFGKTGEQRVTITRRGQSELAVIDGVNDEI